MQENVEFHGQNCYIPTSGHCFIKFFKIFTRRDYTKDFLIFIRSEKYRAGVINSARIQPFCRRYKIKIGCFDRTRINP